MTRVPTPSSHTSVPLRELLDQARFLAWLRSHNPAARVGTCGNPLDCPLANYLIDSGVPQPGVGDSRVTYRQSGRLRGIPAPKWVAQFVKRIDALGGPVRAYQAWQILEHLS